MGYDRRWQDQRGTRRQLRPRPLGARVTAMRCAPRDVVAARLRASCSTPRFPHVADARRTCARAPTPLSAGARVRARGRRDDAARARAPVRGRRADRGRLPTVAAPDWRWCEDVHDLRQRAPVRSAAARRRGALDDQRFVATGSEMLDFYAASTVEDGMFVPIGNAGLVSARRRARASASSRSKRPRWSMRRWSRATSPATTLRALAETRARLVFRPQLARATVGRQRRLPRRHRRPRRQREHGRRVDARLPYERDRAGRSPPRYASGGPLIVRPDASIGQRPARGEVLRDDCRDRTAQRRSNAAVEHTDGPCLIFAGAGPGRRAC